MELRCGKVVDRIMAISICATLTAQQSGGASRWTRFFMVAQVWPLEFMVAWSCTTNGAEMRHNKSSTLGIVEVYKVTKWSCAISVFV